MRRVFLWAARNRWLKEHLPRLPFMRRAVRRFMPGETLEDALAAALPLQAAGIATMYTRLGENLERLAEADDVAAHYLEVVDKIVAAGINGEISVKPTQLGLDLDADVCLAHLVRLAEHAAADRLVPVDRHGGQRLHRGDDRACTSGCARSSRGPGSACRRTSAGRPPTSSGSARSTRPSAWSRAPTTRRSRSPTATSAQVDANYVGLAVAVPPRRPRPADPARPRDPRRRAHRADRRRRSAPAGIGRDGFEVEMLYGIRTDQQFRLAKAGYRVQSLIAYGEHWYPWYMRRLAERPANVWFALRQMLP